MLGGVALYVGTSGFDYPEWRAPRDNPGEPHFYPPGVARSRFLAHYSGTFTACEINATFYRLESPATVERWAAAVPDAFRFATKAHRRLTHGRQISLDGPRARFLERFFASVALLRERLGTILFQFPPSREHDGSAFSQLLEALPRSIPCAFEFRHASWDNAEVRALAARAGGTVCVSDMTGEVPKSLPPGRIAYVRLRHDKYSRDSRSRWRDLLCAEATTRDVYAFAKHEGVATGDEYAGVGLAQWLVNNG